MHSCNYKDKLFLMQTGYLIFEGQLSPSNPKIPAMTLNMKSGELVVLCSWAFRSLSYLIHLTNNRMSITIPLFRDGRTIAQRW